MRGKTLKREMDTHGEMHYFAGYLFDILCNY